MKINFEINLNERIEHNTSTKLTEQEELLTILSAIFKFSQNQKNKALSFILLQHFDQK